MQKFLKSRMMVSMIPYFILALAIIVTWHLVGSWGSFAAAFGRFWGTITPFMYGLLVAYILNMPTSFFQRLLQKTNIPFIAKRSRGFAVLIVMLLSLGVIALALNFIIPAIWRSLVLFVNQFENYQQGFLEFIARVNEWDLPDFMDGFYIDPDEWMAELTGLFARFFADFDGENMAWLLNFVGSVFGSVFSTMFQGILTFVSCIFLLMQRDRIIAFACRITQAVTAENTYAFIMKYSRKLNFNFRMYIYTQTIDGLILGTIMTIILAIAGSPFFLILGLVLGILNYVPYFGSIVGTAIALVVVAFTQGLGIALVLLPIMFFVQQLDGNFIQPKLMGGSFSLSPLLIIVSVTIGGAYAGILGMLMAIPIVAVIKDMLDSFMEYREEKKEAAKNAPPPPDDYY
ncbi:MAG: AI-2E family transporter [Defluviitaleaceae bacterium]|nr:AI-2E family transporter [Defluviitaleaceae bacterium]